MGREPHKDDKEDSYVFSKLYNKLKVLHGYLKWKYPSNSKFQTRQLRPCLVFIF